jgi:hypothetical protein
MSAPHAMKYRVKTAFLGVYLKRDGTSEFVELQPGTVFALRGEGRAGMVKVMCERRLLSVFQKDIEQRSVMLNITAPDHL